MKIDADDFETWKSHPITEALLKCCVIWAEEAKARWVNVSWDGEKIDPSFHARMRERASALQELADIKADDIEETLP